MKIVTVLVRFCCIDRGYDITTARLGTTGLSKNYINERVLVREKYRIYSYKLIHYLRIQGYLHDQRQKPPGRISVFLTQSSPSVLSVLDPANWYSQFC